MCVLLYIGIYLLGLCKCSVFWLQSSEVGDNYYESCNVEHQLHLHATFVLYSTFSSSNLDTLLPL